MSDLIGPKKKQEDLSKKCDRVIRGGDWRTDGTDMKVFRRVFSIPGCKGEGLGFRLAAPK